MEPTGYAAPSRVKALVLPAGTLKLSQFEQYYARMRQASEVLLIDVHLPSASGDPSSASLRRHFDPQSNPTGRITYDFETDPVPKYQHALFDIEPWRQQMLVVGLVDYSSAEAANLQKLLSELRKRHSSSLYHALLVFGVPEEIKDTSDEKEATWPRGVFPVMESNFTSLESTMSTVTGEFLAHLSLFWSSRHLNSFQSPSAIVEQDRPTHHKHSPSAVTITKNGSISMGSAERAKSRQEGRTLKFLGSLYLLSGLVPDALAQLGAAATILKDQEDHVWLGSALSDISVCLVILKYEGNPTGIPSTAVSAAWSVALRSLKLRKATQSRDHAKEPSHIQTQNPTSPHRRRSSVATSVHSNSGSSHQQPSHQQPIGHSELHATSSPAAQSTYSDHESSPRSSISIMRMPSLRKSKPFTDQSPLEDILLYLVEAALDEYSLGTGSELVSHTVYYETIARFVNLLISLRYGWSKQALANALSPHRHNTDPHSAQDLEVSPPSYSVSVIEQWISKVYDLSLNELGPDTQARILSTVARLYAKAGLKRKWAFACAQVISILASSRATVDTNLGHVEEVIQVYSKWPKLETSMLRNLVALGQRIKNPRLQTEAASRLLSMVCGGKNVMMDKEQMTLYHLIRSYGDVVHSNFWDPQAVVDVSVKTHRLTTVRSSSAKPQSRQPAAAISSPPAAASATSAVANGGIIYNPFEGTEFKEEGSIERGIPTAGRICLRNPLAIDVQVFELALVDSHGEYVSEVVKDVSIPAHATHYKVEVGVVPGEGSHLEVSGCHIQASGCTGQVIKLTSEIKIPIIPARPILVLQTLSLLKGCTMLLEGERQHFFIRLWNSSHQTSSKVLHFGFNDSTVDPLRQAVAKQDVTRAEFYEYEYFLHQRRAINLIGESTEEIEPQSSRKFDFELYGKRGVNSAAILVDYGQSEDSLRRLKIPLQITIYPSIGVERVNILSTNSASTILLVLDMKNSWRSTLECKIWADGGEEPVIQSIDAGQSRRFFVRMPWSPLTFKELQQPIPSFSKRQYTVDTKTSPEQLQLFWLRERLLSKLHGEWSTGSIEAEKDGDRRGYVELRTIQLSRRMAEVLRTSVVEVKEKKLASPVEIDKPTALTLVVENKSDSAIQGMLRLVLNKAALRYMLVVGASQQLITVPGKAKIEAEFHMLFLSHGPFELCSVLDPIPNAGQGCSSIQGSVFQTSKTIIHI